MSSDPDERVYARESGAVGVDPHEINQMDSNASNKPTRPRIAGTSATPTAGKKIALTTKNAKH
jgi:hypothetical protein